MRKKPHLRAAARRFGIAACGLAAYATAWTQGPPQTPAPPAVSSPAHLQDAGTPGTPVGKRQRREAEKAYLDGARDLDRNKLPEAQEQFARALQLNPGNANYAIALSVARQHQLAEMMRQLAEARKAGDEAKAQQILTRAQAIDPTDPLVVEHRDPPVSQTTRPASPTQLASWHTQPSLAGPMRITPSEEPQSFDFAGDSANVIRRVFEAYGIQASVDDSVEHKNLRFTLTNTRYQAAVSALATMANVFVEPIDAKTVLVAKDDAANRVRLQHELEETIYLPGSTPARLTEIVSMLKNVFNLQQVQPQTAQNAIVVRAPEEIMTPLNRTIEGLMDPAGEVVVEVQLYEVDSSHMLNAGANIPTQFGVYNVEQAAAQLVQQNSSLVQQAVAQGLIAPNASNYEIAAALLGSGLVQSSLLNSTLGVFGGGLLRTGITETGNLGVNLGLSSSQSRSLDDVQLRVGEAQTAKFREGTRYPITSSTYSTGVNSSSLGNLNNATINGVSVANLLSQYANTASTTIPLVTYEDLGITLEAVPSIQSSGRVALQLRLRLEALTGTSINGIPVLGSREFNSTLTVGEGQSAVLASHVSSSEVAAMSGIPGLSELPGFQIPINKNTNRQTTELVVVVTPHVVRRRTDAVAGPRMLVPSVLAGQ